MHNFGTDNFVSGIHRTTGRLTLANHWEHILIRVGYRRGDHRVEPGLYALGNPTPDSAVFVTSNYTLSFDAVRTALDGFDAYILVLDTEGVNVWCAAGKGSFGTDELVHRIEEARLSEVVTHRVMIVPQLGAPGIAAHEVKKRSTFKVEYGPVRASDLPAYLETRTAAPEMRRVYFTMWDRLTLIPIEVTHIAIPLLIVAIVLWLLGMRWSSLGWIAAILSGAIFFPILLPWLPTSNFSTKGFVLGATVAIPFAILVFLDSSGAAWWVRGLGSLSTLLLLPPITAFGGLNFTGSTTFASRTGVKGEIFTYVPVMAWMFGAGLVLKIALLIGQVIGG